MPGSINFAVRFGPAPGRQPRQRRQKDPVHERALARTAHAGDAREDAERQLHVHVLQVVLARAEHLDEALRRPTNGRHLDRAAAREICAGNAERVSLDLFGRSFRNELSMM